MSDLPTIDIKGKEYVTVDTRVAEFHKLYPEGEINTELMTDVTSNRIVMQARVWPNNTENKNRMFTGWAQEMVGDGFINKASALENCETSAVGRALGFLGIGLVGSIATADEVEKAKDMSKSPDLNKPTNMQKQQIFTLSKELGISPTADDSEAYSQYCMDAIGVPMVNNQDQAKQLIAHMQEDILDREAQRAVERDPDE